MDGVGEWRLIEPERSPAQPQGSDAAEPRASRMWMAAVGGLVLLSAGIAIWATLPSGGVAIEARNVVTADDALGMPGSLAAADSSPGAAAAAAAGEAIIIDVQGAVMDPGVHELPAGSRVADAVAAAGGYSAAVDVRAAAAQLNLAARVADGDKIRVPALGDAPDSPQVPADAPGTALGGGLVDLNLATAEELDTLPGIGPVTAAKILDAREQTPFTSVDELRSRGVLGDATFEKVRDLVTVGR